MGRSPTCRSTDADRRDYSWVDTPSDPDIPRASRPGGQAVCRSLAVRRAHAMWFTTLHRKDGDRPMTEAQNDWDLERVQVPNLAAAAAYCWSGRHGARRSGGADPDPRRGRCAPAGAADALGGVQLAEHDTPGRRRFRSCAGGWDWWPAAGTGAGNG